MNAMTGAAMAKPKKRSSGLKLLGKQAIDEGTPETRARLRPPPWDGWPQELQDAAVEMDLAIRIRAGRGLARGQKLDPDAAGGDHKAGDLGPYERRCYERYVAWIDLMRLAGLLRFVPAICWFVVEAEAYPDVAMLRQALEMWASGRLPRRIFMGTRKVGF